MIDWFVNFEHFSYELHNDTPYGLIPDSLDLVPLGDLILETFGGEWGSEEKSEKASVHIRCIRGTDIPNVLEANYRDIPPVPLRQSEHGFSKMRAVRRHYH